MNNGGIWKYWWAIPVGTLFAMLILAACDETPVESKAKRELTEKYHMVCTQRLNADHFINRCENEEIVCYFRNDHPFCKFKQP